VNKLKEVRKSRGLAQMGLAVKANISTTTVVAIERYDYTPSPNLRRRIAQALQVDETEIWPEEASDEGINE